MKILTTLVLMLLSFNATLKAQENIFIDNNNQLTLSFVLDSAATHTTVNGLYVCYPDSIKKKISNELHYPMYARTQTQRLSDGRYRVTVYQIYFYTGAIALPAESFAINHKRIRKAGLPSVLAIRDFLIEYFKE